MNEFEIKIQKLKDTPEMCMEIDKYNELNRKYRRMIIKNYVVLYTIDKTKKVIYIAHVYYTRKNYLQ